YVKNNSFIPRQIVVVRQKLLDNHKLKITNYIVTVKGLITAGNIYLSIFHHVFYNVFKHKINPWRHTETKIKVNPYHIVLYYFPNAIVHTVRFVYHVYVNKPVNIGAFRAFL